MSIPCEQDFDMEVVYLCLIFTDTQICSQATMWTVLYSIDSVSSPEATNTYVPLPCSGHSGGIGEFSPPLVSAGFSNGVALHCVLNVSPRASIARQSFLEIDAMTIGGEVTRMMPSSIAPWSSIHERRNRVSAFASRSRCLYKLQEARLLSRYPPCFTRNMPCFL